MDNEVYYCTHCGAANKKSAVECSECEKKIISKYRPFYDFLIKHTKDEASGAAVDSIFSLIQKFLLSHVYGIALSVSIVASAVAAVQVSQPYIQKVDVPVSVSVSSEQDSIEEEQAEQSFELTEDDLYDFEHLAGNYDAFADNLRSEDSRYWDGEAYYSNASEMYAETNIPGFSYGGVHELIANPISIGWNNIPEQGFAYQYISRYTASAVTGEACTTDLAKKLVSDGYRVAECDYIMLVGSSEDENHDTLSGPGDNARLKYRFVFVEHEGKWYIAEDRLTERFNV